VTYLSDNASAPVIFCKISAQVIPSLSKTFSSVSSHPRSIKVLTKAGLPSYHRSSGHGICLGNVAEFTKRDGVAVGISDKIISIHNMIWLCFSHKLLGRDFDHCTLLDEDSRVLLGEERATRRPGELETKWIIRTFGCW
jgi:hypothetical protein